MEQDNELIGVEINLNPETMDESYLTAMGAQVEILLQSMFGGGPIGAAITGTNSQINAFARALGNEKRYLETFTRYGLTNPATLRNRHKLEQSIAKFELETGIKWPFK
jgi:hypothetical protein